MIDDDGGWQDFVRTLVLLLVYTEHIKKKITPSVTISVDAIVQTFQYLMSLFHSFTGFERPDGKVTSRES